MAHPSKGAPAPTAFTPAQDQSTVSHLRISIEQIQPLPDGSVRLHVVSGNVGFALRASKGNWQTGQPYMLEYPKSGTRSVTLSRPSTPHTSSLKLSRSLK